MTDKITCRCSEIIILAKLTLNQNFNVISLTPTSEFLQPVFENNRKQGYVFEINFKSRLGNFVQTKCRFEFSDRI